ncbi:MAG: carboxypeptidase regulatory-like domain-containing protein, partial [Pyrinomonadaceae bacterium]
MTLRRHFGARGINSVARLHKFGGPARRTLSLLWLAFALCWSLPALAQGNNGNTVAAAPVVETPLKGSIVGRVEDEGGQPVAGVLVFAFAVGGRANARDLTDDKGNFKLNSLVPAAYGLNVSVPGYVLDAESQLDFGERRLYRPGDGATLRLVKGGVITGRVTDNAGEPVVGIHVRALRVRYADGRPVAGGGQITSQASQRQTDDRGIYRLYGLSPGVYVVSAGVKAGLTGYDADVPTYFPSTTRDAAGEVQVLSSLEVANVDIRHRGERGRIVSGRLEGMPAPTGPFGGSAAQVRLLHSATGAEEASAFVRGDRQQQQGFAFEGVAEGQYDLVALGLIEGTTSLAATARGVRVRGADVTGLRLTLVPLASIVGRVVFETAQGTSLTCPQPPARRPRPEEVLVSARRDGPEADAGPTHLLSQARSAPDANGEFTLRGLDAARY